MSKRKGHEHLSNEKKRGKQKERLCVRDAGMESMKVLMRESGRTWAAQIQLNH